MKDDDIDYSDTPAFDEAFLNSVEMQYSPGKKAISLRIDTDVLEWLKAQGKGYQSRINAVLRAYYEAHQRPTRPTGSASSPKSDSAESFPK